ncbi:MAG: MBL fold metallo-hydrolase RNA specificity domain-containing protein, partial [Rhodocyclaceae bacterium]
PRRTFVVHGEAATAMGFAEHIHARLGWAAEAPVPGQRVALRAD